MFVMSENPCEKFYSLMRPWNAEDCARIRLDNVDKFDGENNKALPGARPVMTLEEILHEVSDLLVRNIRGEISTLPLGVNVEPLRSLPPGTIQVTSCYRERIVEGWREERIRRSEVVPVSTSCHLADFFANAVTNALQMQEVTVNYGPPFPLR
jgi:hypothetical protein